jgi:hypothetical protein
MHAVLDGWAVLAATTKQLEHMAMGVCHTGQMARLREMLVAWKKVAETRQSHRCFCFNAVPRLHTFGSWLPRKCMEMDVMVVYAHLCATYGHCAPKAPLAL